MTTLADYLNALLGNVTQTFGHHGETGVDIGLPYGTPVYSLTSGVVVGAGYYGGGGVETIQSMVSAPNYGAGAADVYYQHLSENLLHAGERVQAGELIGFSGGQLGYGAHPSSPQFSNGPHIEIGLNAPYGGIWGQGAGPNVDPRPFLVSLESGLRGAPIGSSQLQSAQGAFTPLNGIHIGGPVVNAVPDLSGLTGALNNVANIGPEIQAALTAGVNGFIQGATLALKQMGWFIIALAIMGAGLWLLIPDEAKQAVGNAAGGAAEAALA